MLDNPSVTPVTNRTKERWPPADVLVKYLQDYAKIQEDAGKIHYSTTVLSVAKVTTSPGIGADAADGEQHFQMKVVEQSSAAAHRTVRCETVVIASGLSVPNAPATLSGIEYVTTRG